jgi:hypothetical protein
LIFSLCSCADVSRMQDSRVWAWGRRSALLGRWLIDRTCAGAYTSCQIFSKQHQREHRSRNGKNVCQILNPNCYTLKSSFPVFVRTAFYQKPVHTFLETVSDVVCYVECCNDFYVCLPFFSSRLFQSSSCMIEVRNRVTCINIICFEV